MKIIGIWQRVVRNYRYHNRLFFAMFRRIRIILILLAALGFVVHANGAVPAEVWLGELADRNAELLSE